MFIFRLTKLWVLLCINIGNSTEDSQFLYNGFQIILRNDSLLTWDNAQAACQSYENGNLVTILSDDLGRNITELLKAWAGNLSSSLLAGNKWDVGYHISAKKKRSERNYRWSNRSIVPERGSSDGYENWYRTEPNCQSNNKKTCCAYISAVTDIDSKHTNIIGKWADFYCSGKKFYICEVPCGLCVNRKKCNFTTERATCVCLKGYLGATCETFASKLLDSSPTTPISSDNFTLTCKIKAEQGMPLPAVRWKITSLQLDATIKDIPYSGSSFAVQNTMFVGNDVVESNLTIFAAGFCLGPSKISCWANYTESELSLHTFTINEASNQGAGMDYFVFDDTSFHVNSNAFLTVINIESAACVKDNTSTITIRMRPSSSTAQLVHEIRLLNLSGTQSKIRFVPQKENSNDGIISTIFSNLKPRTEYNITISLAPDICRIPITVTNLVRTGFVTPKSVENADASLSRTASCNITWTWIIDQRANVTNFAIDITKYPNITTSNNAAAVSSVISKESLIINSSLDTRSISIPVLPNRRHKISVFPQSCAGDGRFVLAQGECITARMGPTLLPSPVFNEQSDVQRLSLTLEPPDETNGPISCIFVIGQYRDSADTVSTNSSKDYLDILNNQNISQVETGQEYLAFAIPSFQGLNKKLELGDDNVTSCNINQVNNNKETRNKRNIASPATYQAANLKLVPNKYYSFYIVSATPLDGGNVAFVASLVTTPMYYRPFVTGNGGSPSMIWIAAVIIPLLIIIAIILILGIRYKRSTDTKAIKLPFNDHSKIVPNTEQTQEQVGSHDVFYENFLMNEDIYQNISIPTSNIKETYLLLTKPDNTKLKDEFKAITAAAAAMNLDATIGRLEKYKKMNRYKNIVPYDSTRVQLEIDDSFGGPDYINASYIDSFDVPKYFIATQGPLENTKVHFWTMIWQKKCRIIVMLTKLMENGKKKCVKYWPEPQQTIEIGFFLICGKEFISNGEYVIRRFKMTSTTEPDAAPLVVTHYQYISWPDHDIPITTTGIVRLHKAIETASRRNKTSPIVVHCSAGAGRTGTLIGIDYVTKEMKSQNSIDIYNAVIKMRRQRAQMVQTQKQYTFIYKVITEIQVLGDTDFNWNDLTSKINELESNSYQEFYKLDDIPPLQCSREVGNKPYNRNKNITKDNIPYDQSRVILPDRRDQMSPYINASHVETYSDSRNTIIAQGPIPTTVNDFWECILVKQVTIIVALVSLDADDVNGCCCYWPSQERVPLAFADIQVTLLKETINSRSIRREFEVTNETKKERVVQIHFHSWENEKTVTDFDEIIAAVREVDQLCNKATQMCVLIHCSDGQRRSGVFCALMNLIDRLNAEQKIDVFRTVKDLRDMRPGMIPTKELYKACYQLLKQCVSSDEAQYANVIR